MIYAESNGLTKKTNLDGTFSSGISEEPQVVSPLTSFHSSFLSYFCTANIYILSVKGQDKLEDDLNNNNKKQE